jgi:hypothetical protein
MIGSKKIGNRTQWERPRISETTSDLIWLLSLTILAAGITIPVYRLSDSLPIWTISIVGIVAAPALAFCILVMLGRTEHTAHRTRFVLAWAIFGVGIAALACWQIAWFSSWPAAALLGFYVAPVFCPLVFLLPDRPLPESIVKYTGRQHSMAQVSLSKNWPRPAEVHRYPSYSSKVIGRINSGEAFLAGGVVKSRKSSEYGFCVVRLHNGTIGFASQGLYIQHEGVRNKTIGELLPVERNIIQSFGVFGRPLSERQPLTSAAEASSTSPQSPNGGVIGSAGRRVQSTIRTGDEAISSNLAATGPAANLERWKASKEPDAWVRQHLRGWNHSDWSKLLATLRNTEYWPMDEAAIGRHLEMLRDNIRAEPTSSPHRRSQQGHANPISRNVNLDRVSVTFTCPTCSKEINVRRDAIADVVGKLIKCGCGTISHVSSAFKTGTDASSLSIPSSVRVPIARLSDWMWDHEAFRTDDFQSRSGREYHSQYGLWGICPTCDHYYATAVLDWIPIASLDARGGATFIFNANSEESARDMEALVKQKGYPNCGDMDILAIMIDVPQYVREAIDAKKKQHRQ